MSLERITKSQARKLFQQQKELTIITVDSTGNEQSKLILAKFEYTSDYGLVKENNYNFDYIIDTYTGYTYYNRYTRMVKYSKGRKLYYKGIE